jgi:nucleotide-binding universal stress UspA family protein
MSHPIVLGYDGTTCATAALDEAVELARGRRRGEIVVVYCHEPPPGLSCQLDPTCAAAKELRDYERGIEEEVKPMLDAAADRIRAAGVGSEVLMIWDEPARALPRIAEERGSHCIVVGSHGEGPLAGVLHRCTCYQLLHRSDVPVMVVPHRH